jgi:hypothetical protein
MTPNLGFNYNQAGRQHTTARVTDTSQSLYKIHILVDQLPKGYEYQSSPEFLQSLAGSIVTCCCYRSGSRVCKEISECPRLPTGFSLSSAQQTAK